MPADTISDALVILSPRPYQVIQRLTREDGPVLISVRISVPCDEVEVRISGGPQQMAGQISLPAPVAGVLNTILSLPAGGWYRLDVLALAAGQVVAEGAVEHFGVGEVFVTAGQSNSTNCGDTPIQQHSGLVATFSGCDWRLADDPQPGCHDATTGGSPWPAFGDELVAAYGVPVGIAATGHGGTSTTHWETGGELFNWLMVRLWQLGQGGCRAVLWHQGETDASMGMPPEEYVARMSALIRDTQQAAGWACPWFVAQATYRNPEITHLAPIREAQATLWREGIALEGPDTDDLGGENRDTGGLGIHFSPIGLRKHGALWAQKVGLYLDQVLTVRS